MGQRVLVEIRVEGGEHRRDPAVGVPDDVSSVAEERDDVAVLDSTPCTNTAGGSATPGPASTV